MPATEGKRHVHRTFYAFANQQRQTQRKCTLSTNQPSPEVISPGHGPIATKLIAEPTR